MFGRPLTVHDLKIDVSLNGGIEISMTQTVPVVVTCIMDGEKIARVHADEGIEFMSEGGFIGVEYKTGYDITELCDLRAMEKKLRLIDEENNSMHVHTKESF